MSDNAQSPHDPDGTRAELNLNPIQFDEWSDDGGDEDLQQKSILRYPAILLTELLAAALTYAWKNGINMDAFMMAEQWWPFEPWRLIIPTFLHLNLLHLLFNLAWMSSLGAKVEFVFGPGKTLGIILLLCVGTSAAQFAWDRGGVGLSGVVYGLFSMLWVLSYRDERFWGAVGAPTIVLMIGWWAICWGMAAAGNVSIGNVAHTAGLVLGALMGFAASSTGRFQKNIIGVTMGLGLAALLSTQFRPTEKQADIPEDLQLAIQAYDELVRHEYQKAITTSKAALKLNPGRFHTWYNLGYAYDFLGQSEEAITAYKSARTIQPTDADCFRSLWNAIIRAGNTRYMAQKYLEAEQFYAEAVRLDPTHAMGWMNHGLALGCLKRDDDALAAFKKAVVLAPNDQRARMEYASGLFRVAYTKQVNGQPTEAIELYIKGLEIDDKNGSMWYNLFSAYHEAGQIEEARRALLKAIQLEPENEDYKTALIMLD